MRDGSGKPAALRKDYCRRHLPDVYGEDLQRTARPEGARPKHYPNSFPLPLSFRVLVFFYLLSLLKPLLLSSSFFFQIIYTADTGLKLLAHHNSFYHSNCLSKIAAFSDVFTMVWFCSVMKLAEHYSIACINVIHE